jgi:hypothetical protein
VAEAEGGVTADQRQEIEQDGLVRHLRDEEKEEEEKKKMKKKEMKK